jgi:hypothetical protein
MTQRERRALLQRLPPAPTAQEVYPHAAGDTCQEAEAVTGFQPVRDMVSERVANASRDTVVRVPAGDP